jgi:nitroreductase
MEVLTAPPRRDLLEEPVEVLHQQSINWLNQILFWKDEGRFFSDLLKHHASGRERKEELESISGKFRNINAGDIDALNRDIYMHERFLSEVLREKDVDSRDYRKDHHRLTGRYQELEGRMKALKRAVFSLMKAVTEGPKGNSALQTIHERRAVRSYHDRPVDRQLIEMVLKAAMMAPSAMNRQPWKFYVVTDKPLISSLSKRIFNAANEVYHHFPENVITEDDPVFHSAPAVVIITTPKNEAWGAMDAGMCAQNLMLAANALGLDSCPVGLVRYIESTDALKEMYLPGEEKVQIAVILGYGDEQPIAQERKKNAVVFI